MPTLYDNPRSRNGYKVRLLASHLGLPLNVVTKDLKAGASRQPDFLAKNAAGKVPVLELEDGTCLPESNAIVLYMAEGSPLLPTAPLDRTQVLRWMFFEQSQILPNIGLARMLKITGSDAQRPDVYAQRIEAAQDALAALERHFGIHAWAALDRFTVADIVVYAYASVAEEAGIDTAAYPSVVAWRKRVEALPAHVTPDWGFDA
ncbi:glutathione S-transferase family protein [Magnetospirillum sulfuroxidans]|uniref:Glutathione S-transferase family protein n=1 Tax=Magnetospirillum sulfuroxidans TaxID=611300 RepID=A0ABS5IEY6_9PROT|nr:glutathione S-transferase family protein [Magnetospirillum sulfuroxidans]MBR9972338.1 glutathione S-transferase family protein [Magnetospirillum sulfuroxidans]